MGGSAGAALVSVSRSNQRRAVGSTARWAAEGGGERPLCEPQLSTGPTAGAHIGDGKGIDGDGGKIHPLLCTWSQSDLLGVWASAHRDQEHEREVGLGTET